MLTPAAVMAQESAMQAVDTLEMSNYGTPRKYILKDVSVTGVRLLNPNLIVQSVGIMRGDTIELPGPYITNAIEKLWRQNYYSDIKAYVAIEQDSAYIELALKERPRVSQWEIKGVKQSQEKKLIKDVMSLKKHSELSDYVVQNNINSIKKYYIEKGFLNVDVTTEQRNDTLAVNNINFVILTFNVDTGPKVKIKEVVINGNEELQENKLKRAMKGTREKSFVNMFKTAKFRPAKFEEDKVLLVDYMNSKGFRDAAIVKDSIYQINPKRIGVEVDIYEGDKYYYRDITWTGNVKYNDEALNAILGVKKGDVYDKKNMNSRLGTDGGESMMKGELTVSSLYQDDGHLRFLIEPVETVVQGDSIDIDIRISEGKQFRINDVRISGNTRTNDRVIRRELDTRPGELYSQSLMVNSLRRISTMGHFSNNIIPDIQPINNELVDIRFNVEETPTDQFEISGGWGAGTFVASVGVTFNNVAMRNFFKKEAWRPYPAGDNQKLNLRFQTNGVYYSAFSFNFLEPWLGGKKPNSLNVGAYYSRQSNAYYTFQKPTAHFGTLGATVAFGKRLAWPDPFFVFQLALNYQLYMLDNWTNFIITNGNSNIISLTASISRNSIDHPIYPRSGSEFTVRATFTPPYSAFRPDSFYHDPAKTLNDYYKFVEYYKIEAGLKYFFPLWNDKLILMARADMGYLGHYKNTQYAKSPFEGYSMGGDGVTGFDLYGVTYVGLRGYRNNSLTPYANSGGKQAQAFTRYTLELRYPFVTEAATTVFGIVFAEGGNAYTGWTTFNPFDLKKSLGLGIRVFLPMVGMLGVDWGYGFDAPVPGAARGGSNWHFVIGNTF